MGSEEKKKYISICIISSLLLVSKGDIMFLDFFLILLSLPLIRNTSAIIPLLFVSSWNPLYSIIGLGAFYYYFVLFFFSLFLSQTKRYFVGETFSTRVYVLFAIWTTITIFTSVSHEIGYNLKIPIAIIMAFFVSHYNFDHSDYCYKSVLWISFLSSLYFFYKSVFSPIEFIVEKMSIGVMTSKSFLTIIDGVNPNSAAQIVSFITIILIIECIKKRNAIFLVPSLMNMYTLVFLGSRTAFYALLIVIALYICVFSTFPKITKIVIMVGGLLVMLFVLYMINSMDTHLSDSVVDGDGSGRFVTWTLLALYVIPNYWFGGIGLGRENYEALGFDFDADNLYFDLFCQTGIVGFVLFFYLYFHTLWRAFISYKNDSNLDYIFTLLLSFLFLGIGESVFESLLFWGTLLFANSIIDLGQKKN